MLEYEEHFACGCTAQRECDSCYWDSVHAHDDMMQLEGDRILDDCLKMLPEANP